MAKQFLRAVFAFLVVLVVFEAGFFLGQFFSRPVLVVKAAPLGTQLEPLYATQRLVASINIVSVTSDGIGQVNSADIEIVPGGKGRVLFNTNPFVEPDTQNSLDTAATVASSFTNKSLSDKDVIYSVSKTDAQLIGGPSAGAAFTVATIAAIEGKKVRRDAAITGTIDLDGNIGQIGGVVEKMNAFAEQKGRLFLIPKGQRFVTSYSEQTETRRQGNVTLQIRRLVPKQVDLVELGKDQGVTVKEVSTIKEAVEELLI